MSSKRAEMAGPVCASHVGKHRRDCKHLPRLPERLTSFGLIGAELRAPLKPIGNIKKKMLWGFKDGP